MARWGRFKNRCSMKLKVTNLNNLPLVDYRELIPLQGRLKDLDEKRYAKLKRSLTKFGFMIPFFVWIPKRDETIIIDGEHVELSAGTFCTLDGHQRDLLLKKENAEPYLLPYIQIEAKNFKEAKEKILVISSQYGTMTQEGLDAFSFDLEDDFTVDFASFDAIKEYSFNETEIEEVEENKKESKIPCAVCGK